MATGFDYVLTVALVELFFVWYVIATSLGSLCGAIIHFLAGRHWAFDVKYKNIVGQSIRYGLVAVSSFALNTAGVYLMTENLQLQYFISKIVVSFIVGIGFNFTMHRYFVFR